MFHVEHSYNFRLTFLKWIFLCETVLILTKCSALHFTSVRVNP